MSRSGDFCADNQTDRRTKPIALPLAAHAHTWGNNKAVSSDVSE